MKTLKLSILDRLMLTQLLPQHGGKIEMMLVDSIATKTCFSADEISEFGMTDDNGNVSWTNNRDKDFEFTTEQVEVLKNAAKKADEDKNITRQNLSLIEKIDSMS